MKYVAAIIGKTVILRVANATPPRRFFVFS
jgi:hypothetical protein